MENTVFLSRRNIGLDLLRAVLILEGVLYHAARSLPGGNSWYYISEKNQSVFFSAIIEFTHAFRMEAFFFLSGMFSAMIILRKGSDFFVDNRKKRVLLPFIGAFLFIPPVMYLISSFIKGNPLSIEGFLLSYTYLHHLWFLVSLSAISLLIPIKVCDKIATLFRSVSFPVTVAAIIVTCNFFFVIKYFVKDTSEIIQLIPVTARFFIYYAAGYALYVNRDKIPQLRTHKLLSSWVIAPLTLVVYAAFFYILHFHIEGVMKYIPTLFASVFSVLFSFWLVFFFERLAIKENYLVRLVVDSALVVYIMHYPVVILLSFVMDPYFPDEAPLTYVAVTTSVSLFISLALYFVVKRNALLSAIFGLKTSAANPMPYAVNKD